MGPCAIIAGAKVDLFAQGVPELVSIQICRGGLRPFEILSGERILQTLSGSVQYGLQPD